jgi:hypothetical protein
MKQTRQTNKIEKMFSREQLELFKNELNNNDFKEQFLKIYSPEIVEKISQWYYISSWKKFKLQIWSIKNWICNIPSTVQIALFILFITLCFCFGIYHVVTSGNIRESDYQEQRLNINE